jgi:tetraacyldisaccharide 4'-kinase
MVPPWPDLVTGIASPESLLNEVQSQIPKVAHLKFRDHHHYTKQDVKKMIHFFEAAGIQQRILLTTEKDGVRLLKFGDVFGSGQVEIYCIPVEVYFSAGERERFDALVLSFIAQKLNDQ